jgi:two-component system CheB/CheR fusion protein
MKKTVSVTKKKVEGKSKPSQIVAIGASAGGLEAITELLQHLSPKSGMTYLYIPHLSPDHKSILTTLLAKSTVMKVQEVTNGVKMEPNVFYIIPPDKEMTVVDGHVKLTPRSKKRVAHLPIDTFFTSLAEIHKKDAIGIVLSGSASDGTKGLLAIKAAGGLTFAQDESAKFDSMPKSAITAGAVDFILSPKEIAEELIRISKVDYIKSSADKPTEKGIEDADPGLKKILNLLLIHTEVDFSHYKMATIKRRILRRMMLNRIDSLQNYLALIKEKEDEISILYQDLLINVTNFFRDTDAHVYLKNSLFPTILKSKTGAEKFRIWIPGCSTGQEAYSISMTILEVQAELGMAVPIQIFATDLNNKAIQKARAGEYAKSDLGMISPKRLQRFYTKTGSKFRIAKIVRDMVVFAPHNILKDPPFSKVDFISCCNLFIYLDTSAQKKTLSTFYHALNEDGYLMLGKSETVGASGHLFEAVNNKLKIYSRRKTLGTKTLPRLLPRAPLPEKAIEKNNISTATKNDVPSGMGFDNDIDELLLSKFIPASVVINYSMDILQFRGETDIFLKHQNGKASLNILKMTAPEIAFELRHSIPAVIKSKEPLRKTGIEVKSEPSLKLVSIEIIPIHSEAEEPLLLILFTKPELIETFLQDGKGGKSNVEAKDRKIQKLEEELAVAKADMQAFALDQEALIEDMQSANEEVVSSNEELQSVNEELETSKEEIESTNEELTTTNQELQTRNELLNESYQYSDAILANIHEPLLVLDKDLRVVSASKSFYKKFNLKPEETEGILLYDVGNREWDIPILRQLLDDILPKNSGFYDFEVIHTFPRLGEKILLLNAHRIVQKVHQEQLILLAISDITESRKKAVQHIIKEKDLLSHQNQLLEIAVEKRTKELKKANLRLEENNFSLQILNKELQSFSYVASHDLQEPLRKIRTLTNRLIDSETGLSAKGKDYFNRMQNAAERMQTLIEDLLSFSSLHDIKGRKFIKTDLNKIIEDVKIELHETIVAKGAKVINKKLCDINIIPYQFRQVMINLISNALKFSRPEVTPTIIIKSNLVKYNKSKMPGLEPEKQYCHIVIEDNGIGFEEKYNEKIFEVFQKLHNKDEYPGTGIGLAIVKKIIENHNGSISAKSVFGKGTTFEMYIPAALK